MAREVVFNRPKEKDFFTEGQCYEIWNLLLKAGVVHQLGNFHPISRVYCRILQHNLLLQGGHYDEISIFYQYLTYYILTHHQVCLLYVLMRQMIVVAECDRARNLPYGKLLASLFALLGVDILDDYECDEIVGSDFDWIVINKMKMQKKVISDEELEAKPRPRGTGAAQVAVAVDTRGR
ncbi:hypothetical protein NE237_003539 [Protea cynaroides]|uniref:Uncharacterized protein n=1 Tax=Protea cynaroides TaxID=273540 RepID=A0A9Q0QSP3_9MAGN|nr:hypothetical protein NE237_003539 [Protea cynaroides]